MRGREMKNELKNCPFCGGEAYIDRVAASLTDPSSKNHMIICWTCRVSTRWFSDITECVKAWNTRVNEK
ncbi:Lar family restriction alleviation protein [Acetoanaerobium sticklandii]|uniref:Lar family restriction alleviation protein n=1 Tax=Acetoanaerobium sticklandii TaxID=1511 RepID=UPI003A9316AA